MYMWAYTHTQSFYRQRINCKYNKLECQKENK